MRIPASGVPPAGEPLVFHTTYDGDRPVPPFALGGSQRPDRRAGPGTGHTPEDRDGAGPALTPTEARQLAAALLRQADASGHPVSDAGTGRVVAS